MRSKFLGVLLVFASLTAHAGDAVLTWDPPLQYEDNSTILPGEIQSYKVYYGQSDGGPYTNVVTVPGNVTTATITGLAKATWYFVATTITTNGLESAYSTQVAKAVQGSSKPKPPRNVR